MTFTKDLVQTLFTAQGQDWLPGGWCSCGGGSSETQWCQIRTKCAETEACSASWKTSPRDQTNRYYFLRHLLQILSLLGRSQKWTLVSVLFSGLLYQAAQDVSSEDAFNILPPFVSSVLLLKVTSHLLVSVYRCLAHSKAGMTSFLRFLDRLTAWNWLQESSWGKETESSAVLN